MDEQFEQWWATAKSFDPDNVLDKYLPLIKQAFTAGRQAQREVDAEVVMKQLEVPLPNETVEIVQFLAAALSRGGA